MKKQDQHKYDHLIEKIDNLEKTIVELKVKLNSMALMWHNNVAESPPKKPNEDKK